LTGGDSTEGNSTEEEGSTGAGLAIFQGLWNIPVSIRE
jgi:hypothetical protein